MKLEKQLELLSECGIHLTEYATIENLTDSFPRESYEEDFFNLIIFMLGSEIEKYLDGRFFSKNIWSMDAECIYRTGDYVKIISKLCEMSDDKDYLKNVEDFIDLNSNKAWIKYTINGKEKIYNLDINDDWADTLSLCEIIGDIERDGKRFYVMPTETQHFIIFYLEPKSAEKLMESTKIRLEEMYF